MKKLGFIGMVVISILWGKEVTLAQGKKKEAQLSFVQSEYDFGDIIEGEITTYTFKFQNNGRKALLITNVLTSCGCTIAEWSKEPILPGKTGIITASFNTKGKIGKQYKTITVLSNAKNVQEKIAIQGTILPKPSGLSLAEHIDR